MTNLRSILLIGTTAASIIGVAAPASAINLYAGGATLPAQYVRQAADCWGQKVDLAFRATTATTPIANFNNGTFNCDEANGGFIVSPGDTIYYIGTGSGRGVMGFFTHTAEGPGTNPAVDDPDWLGTPAAPAIYATKVSFTDTDAGVPEAEIGAADDSTPATVGIYTNGGLITRSGLTARILAPNIAPTPGAVPVEYINPRQNFGRAIQVPILIAPVSVAYDPVYKKVVSAAGVVTEYRYLLPTPRGNGSGGLDLTRVQYCNLFNGVYTSLGDLRALGILNKATTDPQNLASFDATPLFIVGRSDGSGTTSIFSRNLSAVCGADTPATNKYPDAADTLPAALRNSLTAPVVNGGGIYNKSLANTPAPNEVVGKFTIADGNDGVSKYLDFTTVPAAGTELSQARFGYVGADYALPYVTNTVQNTFGLNTADLQNKSGNFVAPSGQGALNAYRGLRAPQSNSFGGFDAAQPGDRLDPSTGDRQWVQRASKTSPVADPAPAGTTSQYPISGTTQVLVYQCYARPAVTVPATPSDASRIRSFFNWYWSADAVNDSGAGLIGAAGFAPMPRAFRTAMIETFITNEAFRADDTTLDISIDTAGSGTCATTDPTRGA